MVEPEQTLPFDPLLELLVFASHRFHRPFSRAALTAGLPLSQGRLTPETFRRAAHYAGIETHSLIGGKELLTQIELPAVVFIEQQRPSLLTAIVGSEVELYDPEAAALRQLPLSELEQLFAGQLITLKPERTLLVSAEERRQSEGHWFWGTLWQARSLYRDVLLASLFINLFALAIPLFIMNVYDRVVPNNALETLWVLAIGAALVVGFDFLLRTLRGYFIDLAGKEADRVLASRLFAQMMGLQLAVAPRSAGGFASNLREFEAIREFLTSATLALVIDLPFVLLFIGVIYWLGGELALLPLLVVPLLLLLAWSVQRPLRRAIGVLFEQGARKQATVVESLNGLESLKAIRAEGVIQGRWESLVEQVAASHLKVRLYSAVVLNSFQLLQQLTTIGVVIWGVYLIQAGSLTMGSLFACVILTGRAVQPLGQLAHLMNRYHHAANAIRALNQLMALPLERGAERLVIHRTAVEGRLVLREVSFIYPQQQQPVLEQLSLTIQPGERIAILGAVGSGKSTLCKLLVGLYAPTRGQIMLDGVDLQQWHPAELRHYIGYVGQEARLFAGTLRENIVLGSPYVSDEQLLQAAEQAGVAQFVPRLPGGYDYPVGEQGAGLSGGQRQMVALARALLLRPTLLLLDEPTAQLDGASELFMRQQLEADRSRGLLLITHRSAMLSLVERLIVLDQGRLVADGPKGAVLQQLQTKGSSGGPL
ncbi:type I secretion system permease/ATPase [Ectothiorhodospiraceae bacterium BW-2]|nr:type I secretion system permease/ATPase [Ectothiorhodospiraceae bacterium BW-2]